MEAKMQDNRDHQLIRKIKAYQFKKRLILAAT